VRVVVSAWKFLVMPTVWVLSTKAVWSSHQNEIVCQRRSFSML